MRKCYSDPSSSLDALVKASNLPASEARLLLAPVLGRDRAFIAAHPEAELDGRAIARLESLFARRRAGEPIAYLTQEREFYGLALRVTPDVLIPRPETELLVERALARLQEREAPRVLELGTGSGAVAVALARARADADVWATDVSAAALSLAEENAARHGVRLRLSRGDWFEGLAAERFDLILSNPPYVAGTDPHLEQGDVRFEPRHALVGGADGLGCIRCIAQGARDHLEPGGWLLFEHGWDQGPACERLLRELGYAEVADIGDLAGNARVCEGRI